MSCLAEFGAWWLAPFFAAGTGTITALVWGRRTLWTPIVVAIAALLLGVGIASIADLNAPEAPCNDTGPPFEPDPPNLERSRLLWSLGAIGAAGLVGLAFALVRIRWHPGWLVAILGASAFVYGGVRWWPDVSVEAVNAVQMAWLVVIGGLAMGPRERLKSNGPLGTDVTQKARYRDPGQRRLYPISTFNSWCARPFSRVLAPVLSPNQVSLASLLVSVAGLALVWTAQWQEMMIGAGLVHVGLLLDHADGQVARRTGKGSTWGMYLDMVIDRIVEVGLVIALWPALTNGVSGAPGPWITLTAGWAAPLAMVTIATILLWRFLSAYNDVLYLRAHLTETARMPHPSARPQGLVRRPLVPWVFNRDWLLLLWALLVALGQPQAALGILLATTLLMCIERIIVFHTRHKTPEGDANRILGRDYH